MKKESIDKATEAIIEALENIDIELEDKLELMININCFLENYDRDIRTLINTSNKRKYTKE